MMGISPMEMAIIVAIALVVIGPDKFPEFAKMVMRTIRDLRGYVDDVKSDVTREMRPVQDELRQLSRYNPEDYIDTLVGSEDESKIPEVYEPSDPYAADFGVTDAQPEVTYPEQVDSAEQTQGPSEDESPERLDG